MSHKTDFYIFLLKFSHFSFRRQFPDTPPASSEDKLFGDRIHLKAAFFVQSFSYSAKIFCYALSRQITVCILSVIILSLRFSSTSQLMNQLAKKSLTFSEKL